MNDGSRVKGIRYKCDDHKLNDSTSGGFFLGIAEFIIKSGGIVYGAAYDENNVVKHIKIKNANEIKKLQGSKYVQSDMGFVFLDIKNMLENDKLVLFTGTPCQVAGLSKFLKRDYSNLITMDFVCHGVPSPKFFELYLNWLSKKYHENLKQGSYTFRVKKHGWYYRRHMSYTLRFNKHYGYVGSDPYYSNFLKGNNYRESCYNCMFKLGQYKSDFTVGDFNGVDLEYPEFMDKKGVSYAIINTKKGEDFFQNITKYFYSIDVDINIIKKHNKTLTLAINRPNIRDTFYSSLYTNDFVDNVYKKIKFKSKIKPYLPYFIEKILRG